MVTVTAKAVEKLKEIMARENREQDVLRIAVRPGGCSGFSYAMGFDDEVREDDQVSEQDGLKVIIDSFSARYLRGIEVDYVETLMGGGFAIRNPNAVRTCGCGQSFHTREEQGSPQDCT